MRTAVGVRPSLCLKVVFATIGLAILLPSTGSAQSQAKTRCQYRIPLSDSLHIAEPLRLSGRSRTESVVFHTERSRLPAGESEMHLFLRHSPDLDGTRSFVSVSLNYALLRSLRLDDQNETELVIPIAPDLLKDSNDLQFSVQHSPAPNHSSNNLWTEISNNSYVLIRCESGAPSLDLGQLPYPLLSLPGQREQPLSVLVPERISTETLEATALLIANLSSRTHHKGPEFSGVRPVTSLRSSGNSLLIVGTPKEQPQLGQLKNRLPLLSKIETLKPSEGLAGLITRSENDSNPVLVLTASTPSGVLQAAKGLFDLRPEATESVVRISSARPRLSGVREWPGFVPPTEHFSLLDMEDADVRIGPGERGAAVIPLNVTPDARFLNYGLQARLQFDLRQTTGPDDASLEIFLNDHSLGRYSVRNISFGSRASVQIHASGDLLKTQNTLRIVWRSDSSDMDGQGWVLRSSEFYLPRHYEARLPDLALLRRHFYPFSLRADLSDTVIVVPDSIDEDVMGALTDLALHLGQLAPADNVAFRVRRNSEHAKLIRAGSHFIILGIERGQSSVQQLVSPWDPQKFVLKFSGSSSTTLRQEVDRFFSDEVFDRLEGDTAYVMQSPPVMRRIGKQQSLQERLYLVRIEAWLRSNWFALPLILAVVSIVMFIPLRLALNQYRARSNGAV